MTRGLPLAVLLILTTLLGAAGCAQSQPTGPMSVAQGRYAAELRNQRQEWENLVEAFDSALDKRDALARKTERMAADPLYQPYLNRAHDSIQSSKLTTGSVKVDEKAGEVSKLQMEILATGVEVLDLYERRNELVGRTKQVFALMQGSLMAGRYPTEAEWQEYHQILYLLNDWESLEARMNAITKTQEKKERPGIKRRVSPPTFVKFTATWQ